jgi:hypothetical protein
LWYAMRQQEAEPMSNSFIALYARQSLDRLDSVSIEMQIEYCRQEVRAGIFQEYIDRG